MPEFQPTETAAAKPEDAFYEPFGDDLFKLTLTQENKAAIFGDALDEFSHRSSEASSVLENLAKWSPPAASLFTRRSPSTILDTPFRLIFPNDALRSFDETGLYVRQYLAISYCWHSTEHLPNESKTYKDWPISKPFVDAILNDKDHPREGIWMDQLCIDQSSVVDKQKSVAAMDIIYRSCIRLVVLLEDVFLNEREATLHERFNLLQCFKDRRKPEGEDKHWAMTFYNKVNAARWWERAWCFHEFNVNGPWKDIRQTDLRFNATFIMNGPDGSTVKVKWVDLQFIMVHAMWDLPDPTETMLSEFKGQAIFTGTERGGDWQNGLRSSLMGKHNGVLQKGCTYLGDRLSITINLCGLGLAYVGGELKDDTEVLFLSALLALATGELYPLTMFDGQLAVLKGGTTWLARSTAPRDTTIPKFKPSRMSGIHRISEQEIELDMLIFHASLDMVEDNELESTYKVFPEVIATTQPKRLIGIELSSRPDIEYDTYRRRILAGCIANGYDFTVRLWRQLERDVVKANYNNHVFEKLTPNPLLQTAAESFIAQLLPLSTLLGIPPPLEFSLKEAQVFLTWLTDPRSVYYICMHTLRVRCTKRSDNAFMTGMSFNKHFYNGSVGEIRAAIPTDLLGTTCIPFRVWFMRPIDRDAGGEKWRIVGKGLLLGEPDLMHEARSTSGRTDAVVSLEKRVIVTG